MGVDGYERRRVALLVSCGFFAAVGLVVAFSDAALAPWRALVMNAIYPGGAPPGLDGLARLTEGILGGSIVGKWVATAWLVHVPLRRRERWAARALLASHLAWFVLDSFVSVRAGAAINVAVINLVPLVVVGGLAMSLYAATSSAATSNGGTSSAGTSSAGASSAGTSTPAEAAPMSPGTKALTAVCVVSIGVGLACALAIRAWPFTPYNDALAALYFGGESGAWIEYQVFLYGLIGAAIVGHFVALTLALRGAPGARWTRLAVLTSMVAWFVVDTAVSVGEGAWFNVWMINLPSFGLTMAALALAWRAGRIGRS